MKIWKNRKQNEEFFVETIELTPSNNITNQSQASSNLPQYTSDYNSGFEEHLNERRLVQKTLKKAKQNIVKIIAVLLCLYMLFLIFGALKTDYYIDSSTGERRPIVVSYEDVSKKQDFKKLKKETEKLRDILVEIRIIEIKYHNKELDAAKAFTDYNNALEKIDVAIPKLQAVEVDAKQESIQLGIATCYNNLALYLQDMRTGLSSGDSKVLNSALQYRDLALNSYFAAESSLKTLAESLKIQDDFFNWELDKAASKKDPSAVLIKE